MTPQLLQYIRQLTANDRKTLAQKGLKTSEEVGELSAKILSFENAPAATHRVVERQAVLEEAVDTLLAALSVAYDLRFTDEELEAMIVRKTEKWASIQAREAGVKYPLPYEIHLTVKEAVPAIFRHDCAALGVKPIFLALQDRGGVDLMSDVMTSSTHFGDNASALVELDRIAAGLTATGYIVERRKIETVPWHPAAPSTVNGVKRMPDGGYFESHMNVILNAKNPEEFDAQRARLQVLARHHDAHLSRNVFKQLSPTASTVMLTLRSYSDTRERFSARRDALHQALTDEGFCCEKLVTEFSIFDSKTAHDAAWLETRAALPPPASAIQAIRSV
jgi:NTP pyrophosphatase (non-canonical NTP hydrolase)